ncbi:flagellar biosynthesis regulator FlaF [Breoghania sp. L-A4]|uniref:flagellar biosynthesis regulator FlaF n=1 Tax=Breoghania sp. L-A4 TaxID=2304600 RepID=UPI001967A8A8|nr:flagellar biosynthesis regulator FlaF [Breoghania sp. L-A4]
MSQVAVSPRDLEATLLMKAAAQLQTLKDDWDNASSELIHERLTYNRRLWVFFLAAIKEEGNPLPEAIKNNILSLGVFILNHTIDTELKPTPERLTVLITINRNIAEGLRNQG